MNNLTWGPTNETATPFSNGDMPLCTEINSRTKIIADGTGLTVLIDNEYEHSIEFNILLKLKKGMSQIKIEELLS